MSPNSQETVDLVTITEEILNGKLHFLCSDTKTLYRLHYMWTGLSEKNQDLVYTLTEMIFEPYQSYTIELFSKWLTALSRCFSKKLNLRCLNSNLLERPILKDMDKKNFDATLKQFLWTEWIKIQEKKLMNSFWRDTLGELVNKKTLKQMKGQKYHWVWKYASFWVQVRDRL